MKSVFFDRLETKIRDKIVLEGEWVLDGGPADLATYRLSIGVIKGLRDALELAKEVDAEQMGMSNANRPTATSN